MSIAKSDFQVQVEEKHSDSTPKCVFAPPELSRSGVGGRKDGGEGMEVETRGCQALGACPQGGGCGRHGGMWGSRYWLQRMGEKTAGGVSAKTNCAGVR